MEGVIIFRAGYFGAAGHAPSEAACPEVDVAVIGGGPAGASTATTLARAGVHVALLERAAKFVPKVGEALPPRVAVVLKNLGVWERFLADDHLRCYGNRSAWGTSRLQEYDFIFDPHGCGWHVDRARFDAMLVAAARDAGALWLSDTKVTGWLRSGKGWSLDVRRQGQHRESVHGSSLTPAGARQSLLVRRLRSADDMISWLGWRCGWWRLTPPSRIRSRW